MKLSKVISLLAVTTLITTLFTGCGSTDEKKDGKTTLRFATWDSDDSLALQQELVDKFNKENKKIKVELEAYGNDFDTKLAAGFGANDAPDVMYMWNYPQYSGALEPLDSYINKEKEGFKGKFYDALWNYNSLDSNVYGIPVGYTTHVVYYNKELFDEAGVPYPSGMWTWEELIQTAKKLTNKKDKVYGFAFSATPDPYDFEMNLWNNGTSYAGTTNKLDGNINSEKSLEVFDMYQKMLKDGVAIATEGSGSTEMKSGKVGMFINGSWSIESLKDQGVKFGVTVLPSFEKGKKSVSVLSSSGISMSKDSKHKDAAWEFINYWVSEDANKERIKHELPVLKTVAESENLLKDDLYSVFYQMLEQSNGYTPSSFKLKDWSETSTKISTALEGMFNPTTLIKPEDAIKKALK